MISVRPELAQSAGWWDITIGWQARRAIEIRADSRLGTRCSWPRTAGPCRNTLGLELRGNSRWRHLMNRSHRFGYGAALAVLCLPAAAAKTTPSEPSLTIEQLLDIKHPSNPVWSPDGKHVVFVWDRAGIANLYVANADGHGQPLALTSFAEGQVDHGFWSRDSQTVYFPHNSGLWQAAISGGAPNAAWAAVGHESDFNSFAGRNPHRISPPQRCGLRELGSEKRARCALAGRWERVRGRARQREHWTTDLVAWRGEPCLYGRSEDD